MSVIIKIFTFVIYFITSISTSKRTFILITSIILTINKIFIFITEIFPTLVEVSPRIYKKYILPVNNLTDDEINIIRINLTNLIIIDIKIKKYITNQKPKELPVRKLSIFN